MHLPQTELRTRRYCRFVFLFKKIYEADMKVGNQISDVVM